MITGVSGLIGIEIARYYLEKGIVVVGLRRNNTYLHAFQKFKNYYQITCNLGNNQVDDLPFPFNIEIIFHSAALIPKMINNELPTSHQYFTSNIIGTME